MESWIDWIIALLMDLELGLYKSMGRNLSRHLREEKRHGFRWVQWQAIQLRGMRRFRRSLSKEVDRVFDEIMPEIEREIEKAYERGKQSFDNQIEAVRKIQPDYKHVEPAMRLDLTMPPPSDDTFAHMHRERLKTVILDVRRDMDKARYGAAQRAGAIYEDMVKRADVIFQTGTTTLLDAVEYATKEAAASGLNAIEYSNGRRVNVSTYVEMALRTSARRAANEAEGVKREQWGTYLVISPTLHSTCDTCQTWQGKVLIDDVYSNGKPDGKHPLLSEAVKPPSHFQGPNCRHPLVLFIEGITQIPKASDWDQTRDNYKAEQRQRHIELMIRKWKRQASLSVSEEEQKKASIRVRAWQAAMREHLRLNPQLRRNAQREKLLN